MIEGLQLGLDLGIEKLIIEGDSQIILNAIRKGNTPNWKINSKLEYALTLIDKFEETIIQHIYREGNKEVDILTNQGANGENFVIKNHPIN